MTPTGTTTPTGTIPASDLDHDRITNTYRESMPRNNQSAPGSVTGNYSHQIQHRKPIKITCPENNWPPRSTKKWPPTDDPACPKGRLESKILIFARPSPSKHSPAERNDQSPSTSVIPTILPPWTYRLQPQPPETASSFPRINPRVLVIQSGQWPRPVTEMTPIGIIIPIGIAIPTGTVGQTE